ncbi:MAG: hypothetical protein QOI41_5516 [Myxococcales bacterium]|nr:hypothetical protein [Myxococcales bacterium]
MHRIAAIVCVAFAGIALSAAGCNGGADFGLGLDTPATEPADGGPGVTPSAAGACVADAAPIERLADPSTLPACAPACGGAHCVPSDKVPEVSRPFFAACGGGYCLPDKLIISGGAKPPSCKSLNGADGVCLGLCVPQVALNKDVLSQGSCASDERCTPCINPNDNKPTGACDIGTQLVPSGPCPGAGAGASASAMDAGPPAPLACPYVGPPVVDPAPLPACGGPNSGAHCLPAHLAPADLVSKLATCSGGYCVPDKLIASAGRFIPATCSSLLGAEGRCTNAVLPLVNAQSGLPVATCDANERCAPCFSPIDGSDTGACKTSCDPGPKGPAKTFTSCCNRNGANKGKCVPKTAIPATLTSRLQTDACAADALCVPTENLPPSFVPPACSASTFLAGNYTGVCLSDCLDFGTGSDLFLDRGNCQDLHMCIPCVKDGKPTGAPGCPP